MFAVSLEVLNRIFGNAFHVNQAAMAQAEYAGDPTNNVTPAFAGQFCKDTSGNHLYWASGTASSSWKKLNN